MIKQAAVLVYLIKDILTYGHFLDYYTLYELIYLYCSKFHPTTDISKTIKYLDKFLYTHKDESFPDGILHLRKGSLIKASRIFDKDHNLIKEFSKMQTLISGFESEYGIMLLSHCYDIAKHETGTLKEIISLISIHKVISNENHIRKALERLISNKFIKIK